MRNGSESAVDRLIELALEEKPARPVPEREFEERPHGFDGRAHEFEDVPLLGDHGMPTARELETNPVWRALLQISAFLPQMARAMEMSSPAHGSTTLSAELRQTMGTLELASRDLRAAMTEQTTELKRMEGTVAKSQETTDRNTFELTELGEDVKSMRNLMKMAVGMLMVLVIVLAGMVIFLLVRLPHH
jgi:hypothetical protein